MNQSINKQHKVSQLARALVGGGLLTCGLVFASAAQAAISFEYDYSGNTAGQGFLDATHGAARQAALVEAGNRFSTMFGSHFTNSGTIKIGVTSTNDINVNTLASAGTTLYGSGTPGFTLIEVIKTKLLTGFDHNASDADGSVDVNFGYGWELDYATTPSGGKYDFYGVLFHEFTHAFGFASYVAQDGSPLIGTKAAGEWGTFDQYLVDKNGNHVVNPDFSLNQTAWDTGSIGGTSPAEGMFFNGANAMAANGGNAVGLFSPTTWIDGSSVSHLDSHNSALNGMMMRHEVSNNVLAARNYSAIEVGIMQDLGYTPLVPEPETYAMMLAGLGLVGWATRRRRA